MNAEQPRSGKCEAHGLQVAPDGLCTLCRRTKTAPAAAESSSGPNNKILGAVALLGIAVTLWWAFSPKSTPEGAESAAVSHGPSLDEQIKSLDDQLRELKAAAHQGELDPSGQEALSRLEIKRKLLVAARTAQEKN